MLGMAKHNLAVLLCLLAAIWATGTASDVLQKRFKIEGSAGYLRGMYSMIEAEKYRFNPSFEPILTEAIVDGNFTGIRDKLQKECLETNRRFYNERGMLEWAEFLSNKNECTKKKEEKTKLSIDFGVWACFVKLTWALIEISNVDGRCDDRDQWEVFLSANGSPNISKKDKTFMIYVNHLGRKKLKHCAPKAVDFLLELPKNVTEDLDTFFKTLFHLPPDASDLQLYEKLNHTNLLKDELDLAPTLKLSAVIQTVREVRRNENYKPKNGYDVTAFINHKCDDLAASLSGMLDVILLSEDSEMRSKLDDRVKKWIEYDHACWYTRKYQDKFFRHFSWLLIRRKFRGF
jgi:hypothetical protein